jgi:glucose/arabinose dehydrogenase
VAAVLMPTRSASRAALRVLAVVVAAALVAIAVGPVTTAASTHDIRLQRILTGYQRPLLVTNDGSPGRSIFIVEQTGAIHRATFRNGAWRKQGTFLDLRSLVNDPVPGQDERGLLGLAFDPRHAKNGRLYAAYTRAASGADDGDLVVARFRRMNRAAALPESRREILVVDQPYTNHNGGHVTFGPDGHLYLATGDGGGPGDPDETAQDLQSPLGKLLRIVPRDPDGPGPLTYTVPADNPYVGADGLDEIWASGLRHPWRFSFDRASGDLWVGDVGQERREEVDHAVAGPSGLGAGRGLDFGWDGCEGRLEYEDDEGDADDLCSHDTLPLYDYAHGKGRCSVTGGFVYRGPDAPAWRGLYVAGDYCGRIFALDRKGRVVFSRMSRQFISSFGEDAAGRLFLTDLAGNVYRLKLKGTPPRR